MSHTYELVCHDCKQALWVGQGTGDEAYIYWRQEHRQQLRDFLFTHQQHRLEFGDDEKLGLDDYEHKDKP